MMVVNNFLSTILMRMLKDTLLNAAVVSIHTGFPSVDEDGFTIERHDDVCRVRATWNDGGQPFAVFENLPAGKYGCVQFHDDAGHCLWQLAIGWSVEDFPELIIPFDVPEDGCISLMGELAWRQHNAM